MSTTLTSVGWVHPTLGLLLETACERHASELRRQFEAEGLACTSQPAPEPNVCLRCSFAVTLPSAPTAQGVPSKAEIFAENQELQKQIRRLTDERDEARRQRDALNPGEGRVVVELPEPVRPYDWDWSSPAGRVEAYNHQGVPRVVVGHAGDWSADDAERVFLAGLAACRTARQLSTNDRAARSPQDSEVSP